MPHTPPIFHIFFALTRQGVQSEFMGTSQMEVTLRPGTPNDAEACGVICYEAFKRISEQHNFPPDFPSPEPAIGLLSQLLAGPDVYSVVAERDGKVVGSNFLWEKAIIAGVGQSRSILL